MADTLEATLEERRAAREARQAMLERPPAPETIPTPTPPQAPAPKGVLEGFKTAVSGLTKGVSRAAVPAEAAVVGAVRTPGAAIGGLFDFAADTGRFLGESAAPMFYKGGALEGLAPSVISASNAIMAAQRVIGLDGKDVSWSAAQNAGIGTTAAVVMDPNEERLSNMLKQLGVETEFTDWLAHDDEEGALEGRFKNAIEQSVTGFAADGAFKFAKWARALARGDHEAAAAIQAEAKASVDAKYAEEAGQPIRADEPVTTSEATPEAYVRQNLDLAKADGETKAARDAHKAAVDKELARGEAGGPAAAGQPDASPPSPQAAAATPETPAAPEAPQKKPRPKSERDESRVDPQAFDPHGRAAIVQDANDLMRKVGVGEKLDPATVEFTRDGRIVVSPAAKFKLDSAGHGRAFTDRPNPAPGVILQANRGGQSRIVGVMTRNDLDEFAKEVTQLRDAPADALNIKPGTPLGERVGQWTISQLGTAEDTPALLRAMIHQAGVIKGRDVEGLSKGILRDSDLMVEAASRATGEDTSTLMAAAQDIAGIGGDLPIAVKTIQTVQTRLARDVDQYIGVNWQAADDAHFEKALLAVHNAMTMSSYFMQIKTGLGRALRAVRLPDADTYVREAGLEGKVAGRVKGALGDKGMSPLPRDREELSDWLEMWNATKADPQSRSRMLQGLNTLPDSLTYTRQSLANLFTANILSGVPSIALNVTGPAMVSALRAMERTSGAYVASLNPFLSSAARQELLAVAENTPSAYLQAIGDIRDVFKFARDAFGENRTILGGGGTIQDTQTRFGPITDGMLRAARGDGADANAYWLGNLLNVWPRAFGRINNGLDEMAKRLAYNGEIRARAMLEAGTQGLSGDDLKAFVRSRLDESTDEIGRAANDDALRAAERTTLTGTPGGEGTYARRAANLINSLRTDVPEVRLAIPIFNVAANGIGETLRRIPILNYALAETRDELLGKRGPIAMADAHGRTMLGAAWIVGGIVMANSGMITGAGPRDPQDRKVWLQSYQPYSIRLGDKWVRYDRYDILGALLGVPALLFDRSVNRKQDQGWEQRFYAASGAMAQYFRDKTALQTASDLLNFGSGYEGSEERFFERVGGSALGRLVVPNFVTQLGRNPFEDATVKTTLGDYAADVFPPALRPFAHLLSLGMVSERLDPLRNVLGEPIHRPQNTLLENVAPITIAPAVTNGTDPVIDELSRLYEATGYGAGVLNPASIGNAAYDPREIKLENGESLYSHVIRARGEISIDDRTLREALNDLMASDDYAEAADADGDTKELSTGQVSRGYLVKRVFADYTKVAKQRVAQASPLAARYMAISEIKRKGDARVRNLRARDMAEAPEILKELGIDVEDYEASVRGE